MAAFPESPRADVTLDLVRRIQSGDEEAWNELYRLYHDELLFAVRANLGQKLRTALQSEDVLQSVALEAFRALPAFEHRGKGSLRGFLHRLVLNKIRDRADTYSAKKRSGGIALTDSVEQRLATPAELAYHDSDRFQRLEHGLSQLPPDMRRVILLRKLEGRDYADVAIEMERTETAVRRLFSRAMARLTMIVGARP